jgi:hypothetical protein
VLKNLYLNVPMSNFMKILSAVFELFCGYRLRDGTVVKAGPPEWEHVWR